MHCWWVCGQSLQLPTPKKVQIFTNSMLKVRNMWAHHTRKESFSRWAVQVAALSLCANVMPTPTARLGNSASQHVGAKLLRVACDMWKETTHGWACGCLPTSKALVLDHRLPEHARAKGIQVDRQRKEFRQKQAYSGFQGRWHQMSKFGGLKGPPSQRHLGGCAIYSLKPQ